MAMNVKFLRGTYEGYQAIVEKNADTLYFCTDGRLYLGNNLIADVTKLDTNQVQEILGNALVNYYTKTEVDALLKAITDAATTLKGRVDTIEGDYLKGEDKTELEGKITAHENAVNTKFGDYSTTTEMNAAIKVVDDYIKENEAAWSEKTDITDLEARMTAVEGVADAAQTAEEVGTAIDNKIADLNLATTYEPIGAETRAKTYVDQKFTDANLGQYTTEQEVKDIVDGVISAAADVETTITGLTELVDYIEKHGGDASAMATDIGTLKGKVEVIEKKPAYEITSTQVANWDGEVGAKALAETKTTTAEVKTQIEAYGYATEADLTLAENRIAAIEGKEATWNGKQDALTTEQLAAVNSGITAEKVGNYDTAYGWGDHATQGYLKAADIAGKEDKANLKALAYKDVAEKTDLAADVQTSLGLANTALQAHQDISHLATKTEAQGYADAKDEAIAAAKKAGDDAQADVDALEGVVGAGFEGKTVTAVITENAQTCQDNFTAISNQLAWGSF